MPTINKDTVAAYLSIAAIILYFSGFEYINEYFRFFGLIGRYRDFDLAQLAITSYGVAIGVVTLVAPAATFGVIGLVVAIVWIASSAQIPRLAKRLHGEWLVPAVRWCLAIILTFIVISYASASVGIADACLKLRDGKVVRLLDLQTSGMAQEVRSTIENLNTNGGLVLVWDNEHELFLVKKENRCDVAELDAFVISRDLFKTIAIGINHAGV